MTSRDIKKLSIIAETKDGKYLATSTENDILIDIVTGFCQFVIAKSEIMGKMSLQELAINKPKDN